MDLTESNINPLHPSAPPYHGQSQEFHETSVIEEHETTCWGCGSHLLLASYAPMFKCGWCGAVMNHNAENSVNKGFWWRRLRDRCFVCSLIIYMLFLSCGGAWAVYPIVFSISYYCGIFHSIITVTLSVTTASTFILAAFHCAGSPPVIQWGSYRVVGKGGLEEYTFCHYCSKPKSPRTHHCQSCRMCILDMDHHCPFIGNCVGAANHRSFIAFLISAVASTIYISIMSAYVAYHMGLPLKHTDFGISIGSSNVLALKTVKNIVFSFLRSGEFLSARGFVLAYLFVSSVSVQIGLSVLLWQQLCYIYEGNTYLSHLSSKGSDAVVERDCQNICRFFGCSGCSYSASRYLPWFQNPRKRHKK